MHTQIYPWQTSTWLSWQKLIAKKRLHHALLYSASKGSGRTAFAAVLAKTLLCSRGDTSPCLQCHSCKLFDANTHPDFHYLQSESDNKQLGVDTIRFGINSAWRTSQLGGARVILIEPADNLGEAAANALLKTLEEPPKHCYFILLAESLANILPTITSRCNKWIAPALAQTQIKTWLEMELKQNVSAQIIRLHSGSPLLAKEFIIQGNTKVYTTLLKDFSRFLVTKKNLFAVVEPLVKQESFLDWLGLSLLDALKIQQSTQIEITHCDCLAQIEQIATLPTFLLLSQLQKLGKLQARLKKQTGLNTELLFSNWLLQFIHSETELC